MVGRVILIPFTAVAPQCHFSRGRDCSCDLGLQLQHIVGAKIELGGTRNPAAFDAYVRGSKAYWTSPGGQQYEQAVIAGFTEAIRLDPEYALVYADRSLALISFAQGAKGSAALDYLNKAQADARKAIALAPDLAEGHLALAGLLQISLDFPGATTEYERASALAPGNARVSREYGVFAVSPMQRPSLRNYSLCAATTAHWHTP